MSDPRTRRKALWIAAESTYATDPGSGYLAVPAMEVSELTDNKAVLETNRFTGRDGATPSIPGPDAQEFSFAIEAIGFDSQVGDGASVPADDYFDILAAHTLGDRVNRDGISVSSHSAGSLDLGVSGDLYDAGDIIPLVNASGNSRWVTISTDNADGSYDIGGDGAFTGTLAAGCKLFRWDNGTDTTASLFSILDVDNGATGGELYDLAGGRCTSLSWSITPDSQAKASYSMFADRKVDSAKSVGSLATQTGSTPTTPLRSAAVFVNGTELEVSQIDIDFGIDAQPRSATNRENARSRHDIIAMAPTITITPVFANAHRTLKRDQTQRSILVQLGLGTRSVAFFAPVAQITEESPNDDSGRLRQSLTYTVRDAGALPRFVMGRI